MQAVADYDADRYCGVYPRGAMTGSQNRGPFLPLPLLDNLALRPFRALNRGVTVSQGYRPGLKYSAPLGLAIFVG